VEEDLERKHDRKGKNAFKFLRATFFRWAHSVETTVPKIMKLPAPFAVGDAGELRHVAGRRNEAGLGGSTTTTTRPKSRTPPTSSGLR
jgi:hypothetical protein